MNLHKKDSHKNDAIYVSEAIGCVLLLTMLLFLLMAAFGLNENIYVQTLIGRISGKLLVFVLPAVWGVWMLRRSGISFPHGVRKTSLHKDQTVVLSSFGLIIVVQMLYMAVFPSVKDRKSVV